MKSTLSTLATLALSGTATIVIPLNTERDRLQIQLSAIYAAVAATTGVSAAFTYSQDGGNTYVASKVPTVTAVGAASVVNSVFTQFGIKDYAIRHDALPMTHVKIVLTNLDGTNACAVCVLSELQ